MFRILLPLLLLAGLQSPPGSSQAIETLHLSVKISGPVRPSAPGSRVSLRLDVTPKPTMHVYAPGQPDYIPISLTVEKSDRYAPHAAVFPKPEALHFAPLDETQLVYSKPFRIVQEVTLARAPRGPVTVTGTLRYQACDDTLCYPPRNIPVSWTVPVR